MYNPCLYCEKQIIILNGQQMVPVGGIKKLTLILLFTCLQMFKAILNIRNLLAVFKYTYITMDYLLFKVKCGGSAAFNF